MTPLKTLQQLSISLTVKPKTFTMTYKALCEWPLTSSMTSPPYCLLVPAPSDPVVLASSLSPEYPRQLPPWGLFPLPGTLFSMSFHG